MAIIISHKSALEYLRAVPPQVRGDNRTSRPIEVPLRTSGTELTRFDPREIGLRQMPIHLLTSRSGTKTQARGTAPHQMSVGEIPPGLLLDIGDDIYVCGPELVFFQLLPSISTLGAIVLGYELCGSYSHFAPLVSGFYDRPALTSKERISEASSLLKGLRGVNHARKLLPLILEGSASPMETVTSNILFLPEEMGGLSLLMPILNYEVPLDDIARKITGTRTCVIDGAWPQLDRGFEYNGGDHTDPIKDRKRLEALAHAGYTIYTIDTERMMTFSELKKVTDLICADIPRRNSYGPTDASEMKVLHRRLLTSTRCGLGLESALFGVPITGAGVRTHF